jgi:hypothetical protein
LEISQVIGHRQSTISRTIKEARFAGDPRALPRPKGQRIGMTHYVARNRLRSIRAAVQALAR